MTKIIFQPCREKRAQNNFNKTIIHDVKISDVKDFLPETQFELLLKLYPRGTFKAWGVRDGIKSCNYKKWEKISVGDIALFCWNRHANYNAIVKKTFESKELAGALWEDESYKNIYFLEELKEISISYESINEILGYATNNNIQGFNVLDEDRSALLLLELDFMQPAVAITHDEENFKSIMKRLSKGGSLDGKGVVRVRLEQAMLRKHLFGAKKEECCAICKKVYPVEFLVAAHIKRRADCLDKEKEDFNNIVMPACSFGCDALYEKGYILVDNGYIIENKKKMAEKNIKAYISEIVDKFCDKWNDDTKKYFEFHKQRFE